MLSLIQLWSNTSLLLKLKLELISVSKQWVCLFFSHLNLFHHIQDVLLLLADWAVTNRASVLIVIKLWYWHWYCEMVYSIVKRMVSWLGLEVEVLILLLWACFVLVMQGRRFCLRLGLGRHGRSLQGTLSFLLMLLLKLFLFSLDIMIDVILIVSSNVNFFFLVSLRWRWKQL